MINTDKPTRFFFHLTDGDLVEEDDVGQEFPNVASAMAEAQQFVHEIRSDVGHPGRAFVRVVDAYDHEVGVVLISASKHSGDKPVPNRRRA